MTASEKATGLTKKDLKKKDGGSLVICRYKHWKYISLFHGPWLQLPPELLESLAYHNYATPRPHPIDPAIFFDLVKIRKNVDEATSLAVRAASGVVSSSQAPSIHGSNASLLGIGCPPSKQAKLSRERKHRMRELSVQKLCKAYMLDEIAASVATMQGASALEEVASLVLDREPDDAEARYVHFFHEKIPSRALAISTSVDALSRAIAEKPWEGSILRTRAVTKGFKEDYVGAVLDLTAALRLCKLHDSPVASAIWDGSKDETHHPRSLEMQLYFHRAGAYLTIACQNAALFTVGDVKTEKALRLNTKKAIKDYMKFLENFDYSGNEGEHSTIYTVAELFTKQLNPTATELEAVTYHPLLLDALHSFLLCHVLLSTPSKEIQRHAFTVARLARLVDGYPIFLTARSPSKADWIEILRRLGDWVQLGKSWDALCAPAPLPNSEQKAITASDNKRITSTTLTQLMAKEDRPAEPPKRWSHDEGREYPVATDRAQTIINYIKQRENK